MFVPLLLAAMAGPLDPPPLPPSPVTVTILYDAFGEAPGLQRDWGFAALIRYQGRQILFDTGNDGEVLAHNARRLGVDFRQLDMVIISHRHTDHASGLATVLRANPMVPVYAPREPFGVFGSSIPGSFYRALPDLPDSMRYFDGAVPDQIRAGTFWPGAAMTVVDTSMQVAPGIRLIALVSETKGTLELHEISLLLSTPEGGVLVVGCSHPGIERIVETAGALSDVPVRTLVGGLHLVTASDSVLVPLAQRLHHRWGISRVAPGHCTGEPAFAILQREYGKDYLYARLGQVLTLP